MWSLLTIFIPKNPPVVAQATKGSHETWTNKSLSRGTKTGRLFRTERDGLTCPRDPCDLRRTF